MAYTDTLEEAAEVARIASQTASEASQIISDVANGDENTTVTTQSGPVKSVKKAIADITDRIFDGVLVPVREVVNIEEDGQTTVVFNDISTLSTTIYLNGLLYINFSVDGPRTIVFDKPLSAGDQVIGIERQLDNDIDSAIFIAEDYAASAEDSANDAREALAEMGDVRDQIEDQVGQASQYASQAATAADDARSVADNSISQINDSRESSLSQIQDRTDTSLSIIGEEVLRYLDDQNLFSGSYDDLTNKPDLGTAASQDVGEFASAEQGTLAESAVQGEGVVKIMKISKADYDALEEKDNQTLYLVES